jgi:beta-glucanase (GH16 family)
MNTFSNINRLFIGLFLSLTTLSICAQNDSPDKKWKLVWKEDFKKKTLNEKYWSKIPRGKSDWNNYMTDYDSCYAIKKGNLILTGMNNTTQKQDTAKFLTGGIYTKDKVPFANGRIEIKAKVNAAQGCWPAIWLLPFDNEQWPNGGEIDIMERLNHESIAYQTVHSHYTFKLGIKDNPKSGTTATIDPADYNVYAVELYTDSLSFYINNKHTFTYPRIKTDKEGQFPYDKSFYLLIDMQLGGSWVGEVDPAQLPVTMEVDWVRFYQEGKSKKE